MSGEASTNRVKMAFIKEDTYGAEKTGSDLQLIRPTGESLKQSTTTEQSKEIRSDTQTANVIRTSIAVGGAINFELTHDTYDEWLRAAIKAPAWSAPVVIGPLNTISFAAVDNSINDSANGLAGVTVNEWLLVSGAATAGNNGFARVLTKAAGKITCDHHTFSIEVAGANVTITQGKYIENGTTLETFNIERIYDDIAATLAVYKGMAVNTMGLTVPMEGIITGNFGFIGKNEVFAAASGGSGYTEATTTKPMSTINDLSLLMEAGVSIGFTAFSLNTNNNYAGRSEAMAGNMGFVGVRMGKQVIEGTLEIYLRNKDMITKYLDQTQTDIVLILKNATGETYVFDLPRVVYTDGEAVAGGENQDCIAKLKWSAFMHATQAKMMRIASFGA